MGQVVKTEYDVTRVWAEGTWLLDRGRVKAPSALKLCRDSPQVIDREEGVNRSIQKLPALEW